jgi:nuclear pore complex protein Nup133
MRAEDGDLQRYIDKCQLEKWWEEACDLANRDVQEELDTETAASAVMDQVAEKVSQMELQMASDSMNHAVEMLQAKPRYKTRSQLLGASRGSLIRG